MSGVTVKIHAHSSFPETSLVLKQLRVIFKKFQGKNFFDLPNSKISVFLDGFKTGGAGYVVCTPKTPNRLSIRMFLGSNITTQTGIVAERFKTQFSGTFPQEKRVRAYLAHEFGHIFHQLKNPDHYFCLADTVQCRGGITVPPPPFQPPVPSNAQFNDLTYKNGLGTSFANEVSTYGTGQSGGNEFVAEVFCALIMGETLTLAATNQYSQFGGPDLAGGGYAGLLKSDG